MQHLVIWSSLLKEISLSNSRWTIINREGTTLEPGKQHYLRRIAAGMVDGPHWKDIYQVLIPINISQLHWYLPDLDLLTWKVIIYDLAEWCGFFKKHVEDEVLVFNNLYTKNDDERPNEDEEVILDAAKAEYISISNGLEFEFEGPWNLLKDLPYF
ncbi:unnamed protein product [Lactuca saligna]|uniref:Uncharacterized protein n=1 Tax=Lactuca saligna TaxID=75948 RepID=A0AA35ZV26_LACSI|nr:unnamed protein product [Lactuca saligna]